MFKGSRGIRLQYKKSDGSYDYVQPVILPNGDGVLIQGNTNLGAPIQAIAEVDLKRSSDLDYAYRQFVSIHGYTAKNVAYNWGELLSFADLLRFAESLDG